MKHEKEAARLIVLGEGCYIGKGHRTCKNLHSGKSLGLSNDLKEGCLSLVFLLALRSAPAFAPGPGLLTLLGPDSCRLCQAVLSDGSAEQSQRKELVRDWKVGK